MSIITRSAYRKAVAIGSAMTAGLLLPLAIAPAASADTTRTLNLSIYCNTGEAYGLQVNTGSGYYQPSGSSYVVGEVKYFTVSISASATTLSVMPLYCDNQPGSGNPDPIYNPHSITAGTSTITASSDCQDYSYNYGGGSALIYNCPISSLTYG